MSFNQSIEVKKRNPWNIIEPKKCPPLPRTLIASASNLDILHRFDQAQPLAVDTETCGTQAAYMFLPKEHPQHTFVQQIGMSDGKLAVTFDKRVLSSHDWVGLCEWLEGCSYLIGHNVMFDGSFTYAENLLQRQEDWHRWREAPPAAYLNWKCCTFVLFKQLAGEGFIGQQWGLKAAQKDLLLWEDTNETGINEWLLRAGYFTGSLKQELDNPDGRVAAYEMRNKSGQRKIRPDKSQLWRVPPTTLGHYCALDAYSTYLLWSEVLVPATKRKFNQPMQDRLWQHMDEWNTLIRLHVSQQLCGMVIDRPRLISYSEDLTSRIDAQEKKFFEHPEVQQWIDLFEQSVIDEFLTTEPLKYTKLKLPKDTLEPEKLTKAGAPSKNWDKWNEKKKLSAHMITNPSHYQTQSKNWTNWSIRLQEVESNRHFNPNSSLCLKWLFYEWLGFSVIVKTKKDNAGIDEKAKLGWGAVGRILIELDVMHKELSYVNSALTDSATTGAIHVRMKLPGTVTMRLAGGSESKNKNEASISLQQQPKVRAYLECFVAREGRAIVQADFASLEDVVLAEVTRDKAMLRLVGPGSLRTDGYIWVGSHLPVIGDVFKKAGYDPENPNAESVKFIKKNHKVTRDIAKKTKLGKNYGMGAGKLRADLAIEGIHMTLTEAEAIIDGLNKLFSAAYLSYPEALKEQWLANGGFLINSMGLPCAVSHDNMKDLVNRCTQSGGHAITVSSACILEEVLKDKGLTMMWWPGCEYKDNFVAPWILDFHDEHMVECAASAVPILEAAYVERLRILNEWLDPYILIEGAPETGADLAKFKCQED
jgi:hypothetical protein